MAVVDRVHELVAPIVADAGVDLYDIEFSGGILRILVDVEGGIDIDAIKSISRRSSRILDEVDPIPGRYTLEVSSPGLERPLRTRQHFEGAIGAVVKFKTHIEQVFSYDDVTKAKTVFEWNSTPKPGSSSKSVGGGVNPDHSNQEAN
jgi:ribosome maturation factor RimP